MVMEVRKSLSVWDQPYPRPLQGSRADPSSAWDFQSLSEPKCRCAHLCPHVLGGPGTCTAERCSPEWSLQTWILAYHTEF